MPPSPVIWKGWHFLYSIPPFIFGYTFLHLSLIIDIFIEYMLIFVGNSYMLGNMVHIRISIFKIG